MSNVVSSIKKLLFILIVFGSNLEKIQRYDVGTKYPRLALNGQTIIFVYNNCHVGHFQQLLLY